MGGFIDRLNSKQELAELIRENRDVVSPEITSAADRLRRQHYGTAVYMRGLIEFTNYCKMIAITAAFVGETQCFGAIGLANRR